MSTRATVELTPETYGTVLEALKYARAPRALPGAYRLLRELRALDSTEGLLSISVTDARSIYVVLELVMSRTPARTSSRFIAAIAAFDQALKEIQPS